MNLDFGAVLIVAYHENTADSFSEAMEDVIGSVSDQKSDISMLI